MCSTTSDPRECPGTSNPDPGTPSTVAIPEPETVTVFASGSDGYPRFRIPSVVVCAAGTILAFAEGRQGLGDHAANDIVLKRSHDGGRSWDPIQVVASEGQDSLNDPSAAVDRSSGRVVLHYSRFAEGYHSHSAVPGYEDPRSSRNYVIHSEDDGASWSTPREITRDIKRPEVRAGIATCGIGIQLRRGPHVGRLVHAAYQFPCSDSSEQRHSYVVYSDDGGDSWRRGDVASVPDGRPTAEPQVVELVDGRVMMNARTPGHGRRVGTSGNGGESFTELIRDPTLIEPGCQASIFRYSDPLDGERSRLLFSNPASANSRDTGTVFLSYDEGKTWAVSKLLYAGGFAYSCLTRLADGSIGCLYERDRHQTIALARFRLDWLTDGDPMGPN